MGSYKYRVISRVTILTTHIRGLISPLITTPEHPSVCVHGAAVVRWLWAMFHFGFCRGRVWCWSISTFLSVPHCDSVWTLELLFVWFVALLCCLFSCCRRLHTDLASRSHCAAQNLYSWTGSERIFPCLQKQTYKLYVSFERSACKPFKLCPVNSVLRQISRPWPWIPHSTWNLKDFEVAQMSL